MKYSNVLKVIGLIVLFPIAMWEYTNFFFIIMGGQDNTKQPWPLPLIAIAVTIAIPFIVSKLADKESFNKGKFLKKYWTYCGVAMTIGLLLAGTWKFFERYANC